MSIAPNKELVPDTPSGTTEQYVDQTESTVGDSLLQHYLANPDLSPTLDKTQDSHSNTEDPTTQSSELVSSNKSRPSQTSQFDQQARSEEGTRKLEEGDAMAQVAKTGKNNRRTSYQGNSTESDPMEGPGGSGQVEDGFLGAQTQAQSLDTSWDKRRRLSDNRMRAKTAETEEDSIGKGEESVEERLGEAKLSVGAIVDGSGNDDDEVDQLESSEEAEVGGEPSNRESQKENASSTRPPIPSTSNAPLALRNSHVNLEPSASAPSSSPAVAQQLLQRSPRKKTFAPIPETASSEDPTPSLNEFIPRRHVSPPPPNSSPEKGDISDLTFSGPGTSTPAFALAHAPAPAPTQAETRSIPPFRVVEKRASEPAPNPSPVRSHSLRQSNTIPALPPDPALFASSTALAKPAPKRKKTREEWDGISQDTPEEIRLEKKGKKEEEIEVEAEESVPLSPTQIHEDDEEDVSMDVEERDPSPKPTAERTIDMDIDEGDSHSYSVAIEDHGGGTLDTSTVNGDESYQRRSLSPRPTNSGDPLEDSFSDQGPPRKQVTLPLFNQPASSSSASSSPVTSQDHHARLDSSAQQDQAKSKRLSDISEMRSSQELPPTQYEVEATQKVYDVEKSQMSIRSVDMDITNSATWHAPFAHDESTSNSHSRQRSNPVPGRELRRVPPPPTPAVDPTPPRASSPLKQSFQAEDSTQIANDSSPAPALPETSSSNQPQPTSEDSLALPIPPSHHANLPTQPMQPTQEVAESSPDIPLSKRARLQKEASEATSRSSLRRPSPSPTRQQNTTQSSNGKVVPDSEGPTQNDLMEEEEEEAERQPVASTSARDDGSDSGGELGSLTSLEDMMMKASSRKSEAARVRSEDEMGDNEIEKPKDRKGKGKAKEQDVEGGKVKRKEKLEQMKGRMLDDEEEEEEPERTEKKSKGKGKTKVAVKEKAKMSKAKGKGKKKVVEVESESELSSPEETEETNYSDMPKALNTKKPSPKKKKAKVVVVDNSSARKPRRKASGPTIIERSDDEEMEEEEEQQARPNKTASSKRKRQPSPPNVDAASTSKRSKRSVSAGAGASSKKVVVSKGRRSTTGSSRVNTASNSPAPDQPVAGPSRLRFDVEPEDDARTETSDTKPSIGSKLPPSAPFSRCFGLWRDDGYYYSGTIESVTRDHFNVKFDDGNTGKLRSNEIRRCEMEVGDYVLYFGNEVETETQSESLMGEFRVTEIDRNAGGGEEEEEEEEEPRPLEAKDVIIVKEASDFDNARARSQRFLIEAIRISPLRSYQMNNRKLTPDELDSFEGKIRSDAKPLPVSSPPTRPDISAFEDNDKKNWGLFGRIAFLVTYASSKSPSEPNLKDLKPLDKERFLEKLKDNGATIIDWEHLFEAGIDQRTKEPRVSFPSTDFDGIDTILLLADRPTTTMKFLIALALGIPCCSLEFAGASIKAGTRLDWKEWLLPSGYIQSMKTAGIGGQLRALLKSSYDLSSLERSQQGEGVFKNQSFLVIMEKQGKSREEKQSFNRHAYMLLSLLSCCSSSRIDFLPLPLPSSSPFSQSPSEFLNSAQSYTHVFLDFDQSNSTMESAVRALVNGHKGIVNMNWIKQCLMAGRLLTSERIKVHD